MYRPEPVADSPAITRIDSRNDWNKSARALIEGEPLLVTDLYSTGMNTLAAVRRLQGCVDNSSLGVSI